MIDLHSHSTVSDGTDTPAEVVALGAAAGLTALALTDHDTLEHLPEARAAAAEHKLRVVPGCEISCELGGRAPGTMHLLVYFVDETPGPLQDRLGELQAGRGDRNQQIVDCLRANGVDVTLDEVLAKAGEGSVGRPHVARVLMEKGYVESIQEAFDRWLAKGRPAYFERVRLSPEESIALAHASGGVTVMAHPSSVDLDDDALEEFVAELTNTGLDGLECEYGRYSPDERAAFRELAGRHGLAVTGGSDYHGENKPDLRVGTGRGDLAVPDELLDRLESRRP
ncbi:MAG: PHP domain-containing protein [Actinomycetota bacterium]